MGVEPYENIYDERGTKIVLVCNTTDTAFGPVFTLPDGAEQIYTNVSEYVEAFLAQLPQDARAYNHEELVAHQRLFEHECKAEARIAKDRLAKSVVCASCGGPVETPLLCLYCEDAQRQPTTPPKGGDAGKRGA